MGKLLKVAARVEISVRRIVVHISSSYPYWYAWLKLQTTPEEREAVLDFCKRNRDLYFGYRYLAWLMVDRNIAFVSPATVYARMKGNDLIHRWAKPIGNEKKKDFDQPAAQHEQSFYRESPEITKSVIFFFRAAFILRTVPSCNFNTARSYVNIPFISSSTSLTCV